MNRDDDRSRDMKVDEFLENALEPDSGAVQRVVAGALAGNVTLDSAAARGLRPRRLRLLPAAAAVLLVGAAVGTALWLRGPVAGPAHGPMPRGTISNQGDIIILTAPDCPIMLIGAGPAARPAPRGTASIVLLGEPK